VIVDYEEAVRAAGVQVGLVDVATFNVVNLLLAADAPAAAAGDWLLVHVTPDASTMAIVRAGALLLFRHRAADGDGSLADLGHGHQTAMYYEDRLGGQGLTRAVIAARDVGPAVHADLDGLSRTLEQRLGRPCVALDPRSIVTVAAAGSAGDADRVAIAAPLGALLRERVA
jgi:Tfp pilus assembly PilM family ATPase